ncbi:hypothetical protein [Singulisphaera acidiphila]|uniref:Uncharacterized protein n=1 Tax=Singulisphaera acidiphila (strain ATCC BAA-1392 / DSM 18658 / VKM B-2454 / MOB10) TaxID=886293 RepID=L0DGJ4_SINAD|nr:hypothetical protein [Singulisphaera acidiphila]AGA27923.1 hypothetical protein Sinac_3678 [Singulisphaera acidiphila DSM 18658]
MLRPIILAVLCGMLSKASLLADELPKPPSGEARLGNFDIVDCTVHIDRNALQDSLRLGSNLIALTFSGALLRFELPTVHLVRERIDIEGVTCLGPGEGETVLAGLTDGHICRVEPATLDLTNLTQLPAQPRWIGWERAAGDRPAGLVVVTRPTKRVEGNGRHRDVPYSVVHALATGKTFALEREATTFLLDGMGRLWLGADNGEWGGRLARVDLARGTIAEIKPPPPRKPDDKAFWEGVYGLIELRDGQVWAFGGTSHMGVDSGYLTRVDGPEPHTLYRSEPPHDQEFGNDPRRPMMPITHVVEENDGLLVFSDNDVFRVDKKLKAWKKLATLPIQGRWGRPDAVGSYPSVRTVHPPSREGEPYVLATVGDGYVLLEGTKVIPRGLPGQIGASNVSKIMNTSEGTFFFEGDDRLPAWTLRENGWEVASLAPPFLIDPAGDAAEIEKHEESWYETHVLVGPDGAISTVSGTGVSDGTRTTARRVDGKSLRLGRETSSLNPSASFITADGILWNVSSGDLKRFEKGRWKTVAQIPGADVPYHLNPINKQGPPWLLLDRPDKTLWQLKRGVQGDDPRLTPIEIQEGEKTLHISAAIPWSSEAILLATDSGLRVYDPATQRLSKVDWGEPLQPVNALAQDGLGRLWLGCKRGLWMVEAGGKTMEPFDRVPWIWQNEVDALAPDPRHEDGVIVALGSRGAAFVRAIRKP